MTNTISSENDLLLGFLANQREAFRAALAGLSEEQARSVTSVSAMSLSVLLKHVIDGDGSMTDRITGEPLPADAVARWHAGWVLTDDETVPVLLDRWAKLAERTESVVRAEADLDRVVPLPDGVTRWLAGDGPYTVKWLLLHQIEEMARHAGHADIIRESIDGAVGHGAKQSPA